MNEDRKHLYRLDPMKVQEKIYESYPTNSKVRRLMLRDTKTREIEHLSQMLNEIPVKIAQDTLTEHKKTLLKLSIGSVVFGFLGLVGFVSPWLFSATILERILLNIFGGLFLGVSFAQLRVIVDVKTAGDRFLNSIDKIKSKISDLSKGL